jgi:hypothetical protein
VLSMTVSGGILQKIEEMFMVYYKHKCLWHTVITIFYQVLTYDNVCDILQKLHCTRAPNSALFFFFFCNFFFIDVEYRELANAQQHKSCTGRKPVQCTGKSFYKDIIYV